MRICSHRILNYFWAARRVSDSFLRAEHQNQIFSTPYCSIQYSPLVSPFLHGGWINEEQTCHDDKGLDGSLYNRRSWYDVSDDVLELHLDRSFWHLTECTLLCTASVSVFEPGCCCPLAICHPSTRSPAWQLAKMTTPFKHECYIWEPGWSGLYEHRQTSRHESPSVALI